MTRTERYVLVGLAPARAPWFKDVARWATAASIAAEFVKCVTAEEVRVHLRSGRSHSALLVDAELTAFDRDLVGDAAAAGTPVLAVTDRPGRRWAASDLGVAAVLAADFSREDLVAALEAHARPVGRGDRLPLVLDDDTVPAWRGQLIAVSGTGGTGASVAAVAVAQALAGDARYGRRVLLADLALRADQAMLHDAGEIGPGVQELVEAHRVGRPGPAEVVQGTFDVPGRGYRLLLGLRRPAAWAALRPRAFDAALEGLRHAFQVVVADVTGDVEGETDSGSIEVEERNHMARQTVATADVVFAVGAPGLKGVHSLAVLVRSLLDAGVSASRLVPVVNRSPRNPRSRAETATALAALVARPTALAGPVAVPERRIEPALRDGAALPSALVSPLASALQAVLDRHADAPPARVAATRLAPGSLGHWQDEDASAP